jgi:hypothetical protein
MTTTIKSAKDVTSWIVKNIMKGERACDIAYTLSHDTGVNIEDAIFLVDKHMKLMNEIHNEKEKGDKI